MSPKGRPEGEYAPKRVSAEGSRVKALDVIRAEHRSLAAVIHGLRHLVREVREHGARPDFGLLDAMLRYIDAFPERLHHPKEDRYLFRRLRERDPGSARILDELEAEHATGARAIRELEAALARCRAAGGAEFPAFAARVDAYVAFHWEHMRKEEVEVLPAAERHLRPRRLTLVGPEVLATSFGLRLGRARRGAGFREANECSGCLRPPRVPAALPQR
mgnify:CR=1 FL=1